MANRLNLQKELETVLGSRNVYFQPPETLKLKYPCIIYELDNSKSTKADNTTYNSKRKYTVTLIHDDPDNDLIDEILKFKYVSFDRVFRSDNLYHYVYQLFY